MKRAGGWLLGFVAVAAMAGGGWFAMRRVFQREDVDILLFRAHRDPTADALKRGAETALQEVDHRVGRFRLRLLEYERGLLPLSPAWIGTSEDFLLQGATEHVQFMVLAFDTWPRDTSAAFRITPGCDEQGAAAAAWARKSGASRAALLREPGCELSRAIADAFERGARAQGLTLVETPERADLVFYSGEEAPYATAFKLFSELRAKGFKGALVMGEADPGVSYLATRPDLVDGCYLVSPFAPGPAGVAGPHVTAGYFAMKAVIAAIDRANSVDPKDLHQAASPSTRPCALYVARNGRFEFVETLK